MERIKKAGDAAPERVHLFYRWMKLRHGHVRTGVPTWPAGHYYSPLPSIDDIELCAAQPRSAFDVPGVDLAIDDQISLAVALEPSMADLDFPASRTKARRYWYANDFFELSDALVLGGLMRHFATKRVIEIGSGFSSACMLDVSERFMDNAVEFTFVEPFPDDRLRPLLRTADKARVELLDVQVQTLDPLVFDRLDEGDILLIDSSHVTKYGNDVNYLFFEVLPRLQPGVLVHVHDVHPGFEYPIEWVRKLWGWNEAYLLRSFLTFNYDYRTLMHAALLQSDPQLRRKLPKVLGDAGPGGSFWMIRN